MENLKANAPTDEDLDKRANERAQIKQDAKAVLGDGFSLDGLSNEDINKAVVDKMLGDQANLSWMDMRMMSSAKPILKARMALLFATQNPPKKQTRFAILSRMG